MLFIFTFSMAPMLQNKMHAFSLSLKLFLRILHSTYACLSNTYKYVCIWVQFHYIVHYVHLSYSKRLPIKVSCYIVVLFEKSKTTITLNKIRIEKSNSSHSKRNFKYDLWFSELDEKYCLVEMEKAKNMNWESEHIFIVRENNLLQASTE